METTHTVINGITIESAAAPLAEFNDRAGFAYADELTADFIAGQLAQLHEPHLATSMQAATDQVLFTGPDAWEFVELSDGIRYTVTGTTASTDLRSLGVKATGRATYNTYERTVTVEVIR